MDMYTLLYFKWITSEYILYSPWNSAQGYEATWVGGGFAVEWIYVYVWLSSSLFTQNYHNVVNLLYSNTN